MSLNDEIELQMGDDLKGKPTYCNDLKCGSGYGSKWIIEYFGSGLNLKMSYRISDTTAKSRTDFSLLLINLVRTM